MSLFEDANSDEIKQTKSLLIRYRRQKDLLTELEKMDSLTDKQAGVRNAYMQATQAIERAVRLVCDQEERLAIQMRYVEGIRRKDVVNRMRFMDASTVDRKINRGIVSVANSLKLFEG